MESNVTRIAIGSNADIVEARQKGRAMAVELGFTDSDLTLVAAAISEIARNIVDHAQSGEIVVSRIIQDDKQGISVIAKDKGPGIKDIFKAMLHGYSTGKGQGVGLPGAKRLMDEFEIETRIGVGTTVTMKKWLRQSSNHLPTMGKSPRGSPQL
jgi:serine/threonine-protein kinase RsbT